MESKTQVYEESYVRSLSFNLTDYSDEQRETVRYQENLLLVTQIIHIEYIYFIHYIMEMLPPCTRNNFY